MANAGRKATATLVAVAAIMMAGRVNAQAEPIAATVEREATIVLHVTNYADLSRKVLEDAMTRVAMIYERIGVRIAWVEDMGSVRRHGDGQLHLTVLLLSREMAEKKISAAGIEDGVLGFAHPASGRASIFCDRIAATPGAPKNFSIPLGNVIAHEVGHLVLGANSHSRSGIMRAYTDVPALHLQSFDKAQERIIRNTLMEPTGSATRE